MFKFKERFGCLQNGDNHKFLVYLLILFQCAVLNDVHSTWGVVPRHLLYLEKVFSRDPRHTYSGTTQQQHSPQPRPTHFDKKMSLFLSTTPVDYDQENRRSRQRTVGSLSVSETLDPFVFILPQLTESWEHLSREEGSLTIRQSLSQPIRGLTTGRLT